MWFYTKWNDIPMSVQENKNDKLLDFLEKNIISGSNISMHREVSAWTTAAFFFTFIIALYYIFAVNKISFDLSYATWFLIIFLLFIMLLIHAQYSSHQYNRAVHETYIYYTFEIINNKTSIDDSKWEMSKNKIFPKFLEEEIKNRNTKYHCFYKILPLIIPLGWLIIKVLWLIYFILTFRKKSRRKWEENFKKGLSIDKINFIESSIYSILILHTFAFLYWLHNY